MNSPFSSPANSAFLGAKVAVLLATSFLFGAASTLTSAADDPSFTFQYTGSLNFGHTVHSATLLPNGQVLVAGGVDSQGLYSTNTELYDPATGVWSNTGALSDGRWKHVAGLLPDGTVLVAGGAGVDRATLDELASTMVLC